MRPLFLRMSAFGPYADEESLDFRVLQGNPLFLIHGATGAGKTSILDALAFALYGDSSGAERDSRSMRSDFASSDQTTFVELCFSLGERCFRVRRVPEQERPKRRGEGMTTQQAEATLWELKSPDDKAGRGRVLGTRWSQVTEIIEELLGFRSSQFRQVIILPQGRFRELLTARSDEREAILEALFDTERFRHIELALKRRASELRVRVEKLGERRKTYLESAGFSDSDTLEASLENLDREIESGRATVSTLRERAAQADLALAEGRQLRGKLLAREDARARRLELERERPRIEALRQRIARAREAAGLEDLCESRARSKAQLDSAEREMHTKQVSLQQAQDTLLRARQVLAEASQRKSERERKTAELNRLEALTEKLQPLEQARAELAAAESAMDDADGEWSSLVQETAERESRRQKILNKIETLRAAWAGSPPAEEQIEAAEQTRRQWQQLQTELACMAEAQSRLRDLEASEKDAGARLEDRRAVLRDLQAQQLPRLAATLVDGEPCPVCGSREHPAPAHAELDFSVDSPEGTDIIALEAAESDLDRARAETAKAVRELAACNARVEALTSALGDDASLSESDLERSAARLGKRLQRQRAAQAELERLQDAYKEIVATAQAKEGVAGARDIEQKATLAREQRASARTRVAEREAAVPERYREPGVLAREVETLRDEIAAIESGIRESQEGHTGAERVAASAKTAHDNAEKALAAAGQLARETETRWSARLKQAGFTDDDDFAAARLSPAEIETRLGDIEAFDAGFRDAEIRLSDAVEAAKGIDPPDIPALEQKAGALREELSRAEVREGQLVERRRNLAEVLAKHGAAGAELQSVESDYADAGRLAAVAKGDNPFRMSFQRFVLAALLDDVLVSASQRLHTMSKGRYRLQRVTSQGGRRRPGGLDLEVDDAYTGKTRAVTTLSGGEGFQAALALALGLADVVQAYAGGIRLDTMFVDEGFGSLDPEALELAIDTLVDLQASGRLIGVISHVPELKERIPRRLEVVAGTAGSHARFCAGA